ncbi:TetR/AcrR family transcriptional regulator [Gracilinema caldarium]|uniref:TetR/AcrR family transcriptional regulator n=1 Tax=Gracilinema caldarium TaxID=215591 RepID=UPI0026EA9521|nr:TetR/AcrR family transcriptional regulator [Gracilinema caldarium]
MTQADILKAALIVWGRDFYKKRSLSDVAQYLGVTKPALYRHFSSKDALMDALYNDFFDRFANHVRQVLPEALSQESRNKRLLFIGRALADYFTRNKYDFIFFLNLVLGQEKPGRTFKQELQRRGVFWAEKKNHFYLRMVLITVVFSVAHYHLEKGCQVDEPAEESVAESLRMVSELVYDGLCVPGSPVSMPDFDALDRAFMAMKEAPPIDARHDSAASAQLLAAVARAIGEAGPWDASMKFVAEKAGLSKSGLYAHFASKEEMLRQLFLKEFEHISQSLKRVLDLSPDPMDRLYLTLRTVNDYLRNNRDVLLVLDWVRLQRIELGMLFPQGSLELFSFIHELPLKAAVARWDGLTLARLVLFYVVNQLMVEVRQNVGNEESLLNLRELFIYMTHGVKGWKE